MSEEGRDQRVARVLEELHLQKCDCTPDGPIHVYLMKGHNSASYKFMPFPLMSAVMLREVLSVAPGDNPDVIRLNKEAGEIGLPETFRSEEEDTAITLHEMAVASMILDLSVGGPEVVIL